MAFSEED